jgi:hypothetical protein
MRSDSPRSLRRAYVDWVEARIEEYKDRIPRAELLALADEVIRDLRMSPDGQYQLTEMLLCHAIDRRLFRMLKLPGYRAWCAQQDARTLPPVISFPLPPRFAPAPPPAPAREPEDAVPERLACVG